MGKHTIIKGMGAAAVIGVTVGTVKVLNDAMKGVDAEVSKMEKQRFSELLKQQYVTDTFTASEAKEWFRSQTQQETDHLTMYIFRYTKQMAQQFHVSEAEILDGEHYLLQVIWNDKTKELITMRLVNFGKLPPKFEALLDENDGKIAFER